MAVHLYLKKHHRITASIIELPHDKTNQMACAPSEDSDQPGCRGVLLLLHIVGQGPAVLAAGAGRVGYIYIFFFIYLPFLMSCL